MSPRPHPAPSLRLGLVVLILTTVLPLIVMGGLKSYVDYRINRAEAARQTLEVARSLALTVDAKLETYVSGLQVLAQSKVLREGNFAAFGLRAEEFLKLYPGAAIGIVDRSRHVLQLYGPGAEAPRPAGGFVAVNDSIPRAFDTGAPAISNLYIGSVTHRQSVAISVPVERDGQIPYVISVNAFASSMQQLLVDQRLPADWVVSIFDRNGVSVARVPNAAAYVGQPAPARLYAELMSKPTAVQQTITRDGITVQSAFSHTSIADWSVAIGVPEAELSAPLWRSLYATAALGAVALLLSGAVAYALSRRVLDPMHTLVRWATSPRPEPLPPSLGLREADELAHALETAARQRQAAADQLRALADTLDARVHQEIAAREEAQLQLVHAQRMEALGKLAGGIAHDFNNVLQAVSSGLEFIQHRADNPQSVRRFADIASRAATRGAAITSRLLAFARSGNLEAEAVPPRALLENLKEMLAPTLGPDISLQVVADPDLPALVADKDQLDTVLVNLSLNARDAMPEGGVLTLSARLDAVDQAHGLTRDNLSPLGPGLYVRLDVTDTGTGMDEATLARASEPFFTTKPVGKGTGLGLAMARGFAEQSGGGLGISSALGCGSTVTLWLPQARQGDEPEQTADPATDVGEPTGRGHVLLVDDDTMVRQAMAAQLEAMGYTVSQVPDGLTALGQLEVCDGPDLIISDFAMPGMNGLALLTEAARLRPELPAILLTGYADPDLQLAATQQNHEKMRLLRKPITGDSLRRAVAALLPAATLR